jgi:hypothetical protein
MASTMPKWTGRRKEQACHRDVMAGGAVFAVLFLLLVAGLVPATLVVVVRGGRGPGEPPASHPPAGAVRFPAHRR